MPWLLDHFAGRGPLGKDLEPRGNSKTFGRYIDQAYDLYLVDVQLCQLLGCDKVILVRALALSPRSTQRMSALTTVSCWATMTCWATNGLALKMATEERVAHMRGRRPWTMWLTLAMGSPVEVTMGSFNSIFSFGHETTLGEVSEADVGCNRHSRTSPIDPEGSRG